jgi:hypothetical protein
MEHKIKNNLKRMKIFQHKEQNNISRKKALKNSGLLVTDR